MKGLEYEPHVVCAKPRPPVFGKSLEIFTGYGYRAFGRLVESGEEAQQCGLSATRRADDRHEALWLHVEIDPVQHTKGLTPTHVCLRQTLGANHGLYLGFGVGLHTGRVRLGW